MVFKPELGDNFALYIEGQRCAFLSASLTYGVNMIPEMQIALPATPLVEDLPDRTKVHLVFRDLTYWHKEGSPRYCMFYEGETRGSGFTVTASGQRAISYRTKHITDNMGIQIRVLSPDDYILAKITGKDQTGSLAAGLSGTIWEQFKPDNIIKAANEDEYLNGILLQLRAKMKKKEDNKTLDIYDYVPLAFARFLSTLKSSLVKDDYRAKALSAYDFLNRIYNPDMSAWDFKWDDLFNSIMFAYYTGTIGKTGDEIDFFQIAQSMLQLFMYELQVTPNPSSYQSTLLIKPQNHFAPVPSCNLIYPVYQPQYQFSENYEQKPTRLIQMTYPPNGIALDPVYEKYYRNIAPAELKEKFEIYAEVKAAAKANSVLDQDTINKRFEEELAKQKFQVESLITEEESKRGIVESSNQIPSYLTSLFTLIFYNRESLREYEGLNNTYNTSKSGETKVDEGFTYSLPVTKALVLFHKVNEDLKKAEKKTNRTEDDESVIVDKNKRCFIPRKIVLVNKNSKLLKSIFGVQPNYVIEGTNIKRNTARYYCLFQEAFTSAKPGNRMIVQTSIPYSDKTSAKFSNWNKIGASNGLLFQPINSFQNNTQDNLFKGTAGVTYFPASVTAPGVNSAININVDLLTWRSVIIEFDFKDRTSIKTATELIGMIKSLCIDNEKSSTMIPNDRILTLDYFYYGAANYKDEMMSTGLLADIRTQSQAYFEFDQNNKTTDLATPRKFYTVKAFAPADTALTDNKYADSASASGTVGAEDLQVSETGGNSKGATQEVVVTEVGNTFRAAENTPTVKIDDVGFLGNVKKDMMQPNSSIGQIQKMKTSLGLNSENKTSNYLNSVSDAGKEMSRELAQKGLEFSPEASQSVLLALSTNSTKSGVVSETNPFGFSEAAKKHSAKLGVKVDGSSPENAGAQYKKAVVVIEKDILNQLKLYQDELKKKKLALSKEEMLLYTQKALQVAIKGDPKKVSQGIATAISMVNQAKTVTAKVQEEIDKAMKLDKELENLGIDKLGNVAAEYRRRFDKSQQDKILKENNILLSNQETKKNNLAKMDPNQKVREINLDEGIKIEELFQKYTQPIAEYFYYYNRYKSSSIGLPITFNPYISPGFSGLIIDNANVTDKKHILMYVSSVTHNIAKGNLRTVISCSLARRSNEWRMGKFGNSKPISDNVSNSFVNDELKLYRENQKYTKLYKQMEDVPFLGGGEYSTVKDKDQADIRINNTFKRILGKDVHAVTDSELDGNLENLPSVRDAHLKNRRTFQTLYIKDIKDAKLNERYVKWYSEAPSKFVASFNDMKDIMDFPDVIDIIELESTKAVTDKTGQYNNTDKVELPRFASDIREAIRQHTLLSVNIESIIGSSTGYSNG